MCGGGDVIIIIKLNEKDGELNQSRHECVKE